MDSHIQSEIERQNTENKQILLLVWLSERYIYCISLSAGLFSYADDFSLKSLAKSVLLPFSVLCHQANGSWFSIMKNLMPRWELSVGYLIRPTEFSIKTADFYYFPCSLIARYSSFVSVAYFHLIPFYLYLFTLPTWTIWSKRLSAFSNCSNVLYDNKDAHNIRSKSNFLYWVPAYSHWTTQFHR